MHDVDPVDGASKRQRLRGPEVPEYVDGGGDAADAADTTINVAQSSHDERPGSSTDGATPAHAAAAIRGRVDPYLQPPGTREFGAGRGQEHRLDSRLAAQHSGICISLSQHAERVAAKRARVGDLAAPLPPTAAERMAALRRRVADRHSSRGALHSACASLLGSPGGGGETAADHAAARAAQHNIPQG